MKPGVGKLAGSVAKAFAIVGLVVLVIFVLPTPSDYLAAFADKNRMLEEKPGARAILIGGSGMAFGVDSRKISDALGMPVVNTGLHAGVGLAFMLEHVRPFVRRGDIVVLVPEYAIVSATGVVDDGVVASTLLSAPSSLRYVQSSDLGSLLRGFPDFALHRVVVDPASALAKRAKVKSTYTYTRGGFDEHGDEVGHLREPKPEMTFAMAFDPSVEVQAGRINRFADDMRARGAETIFLFAAVPKKVIEANRTQVEAYDRAIKATLKIPVVGSPAEAAIDDELFFDTVYHLDAVGRAANTARIVSQLNAIRTASADR